MTVMLHFPLCVLVLLVGICAAVASAAELRGVAVDDKTGQALAARVYLRGEDGTWHFVRSAAPDGLAARYEKRNWVNKDAAEVHTTVSAHPFLADLPAGRYTVTVERGKEYFPASREVTIGGEPVEMRLPMRRWIDMAARGWYSGETHLHRTMDDLRSAMLAEDLNVAFPLSFWVTKALASPAAEAKAATNLPEEAVSVDATHVIWPRNTEYEIFSVGGKQHTLGAMFVLGHRGALKEGVPTWGNVARAAIAEGAMIDMDKLDWPFATLLPQVASPALYELANNHVWRTEFAFRQWSCAAVAYLQPPFGGRGGGEREWVQYSLGIYYTLLNCGLALQPTAGTASGVHPVPVGFSRVYTHLPDGFTYDKWVAGLKAGHSFVTTGPMLLATANGSDPGEAFRADSGAVRLRIAGTVYSEHPLAFVEVIRDGQPMLTMMPDNKRTAEGAFQNGFRGELPCDQSGWVAVRCWEDRPGGRFRFAHTAPWHVRIAGQAPRPRAEEKAYLIRRMKDEMARSNGIVPPEAFTEYQRALNAYERLGVRDDSAEIAKEARPARDEADLRYWLENMAQHRFTAEEVRAVTGLSVSDAEAAMKRLNIGSTTRPARAADAPLRVLPYPGGRHPRSGFLEGALMPQRETKISVFTPWDEMSYVVADVPEAIFANGELIYLAHTHVPTVWSKQGTNLPRLEWNRHDDGTLDFERALPNGIRFGARIVPDRHAVRMELWLHNGTDRPLRNLRVQNCVMLRAAAGFSAQTNQNKRLQGAYACAGSEDGRRWIITAWDPMDRTWANPPVPCMHSDPKFPECPPGQTQRLHGWLSFHEGPDLDAELKRIEASGWRGASGSK
jgi:hypothetical protein